MEAIWFFAALLAVWRVTHLLVAEDGPWDVIARIRRLVDRVLLGRLINCFLCCSVWVAVPFALLVAHGWRQLILALPALSGGAILLERVTDREGAAAWAESESASQED
ncbi:MAG: hypothetical protein ABI837_11115 [Acidobacteriota bacterium]